MADRAGKRLARERSPGIRLALRPGAGPDRGRGLLDRRRGLPLIHQRGDVGGDGRVRRRPAVQPPGEAPERRPVGLRGVGCDRGFERGADALHVAGGESVVAGAFELVHGGLGVRFRRKAQLSIKGLMRSHEGRQNGARKLPHSCGRQRPIAAGFPTGLGSLCAASPRPVVANRGLLRAAG